MFSYERITDSFVQKVADKVLSAESTVLIGSRYGGKRHVLYLLRRLLEEQGIKPIVEIEFLDKVPLQTDKDVQDLIRQAVADVATPSAVHIQTASRMTGPIQHLANTFKAPVILL